MQCTHMFQHCRAVQCRGKSVVPSFALWYFVRCDVIESVGRPHPVCAENTSAVFERSRSIVRSLRNGLPPPWTRKGKWTSMCTLPPSTMSLTRPILHFYCFRRIEFLRQCRRCLRNGGYRHSGSLFGPLILNTTLSCLKRRKSTVAVKYANSIFYWGIRQSAFSYYVETQLLTWNRLYHTPLHMPVKYKWVRFCSILSIHV